MKGRFVVACLLALAGALASAEDAVKLEPNAKLSFEFPDLPETFFSKATHQPAPALLTAQLPENYVPGGRFPLFVFLGGGNGGRGDSTTARSIAGPRDFIAVSLPLFRDSTAAAAPVLPGLPINPKEMVNGADAGILGRAYRVMLQRLLEAVPNVTRERSAFGGFSNGAHATGALLAAKDEFVLSHFTAFCFFEGGMPLLLNPAALDQPALRHGRLIVLFGDSDPNPQLQLARKLLAGPLLEKLSQEASTLELDFTHITMHGYGHTMPPEYQKLLGAWVRGEKLPEIPVK